MVPRWSFAASCLVAFIAAAGACSSGEAAQVDTSPTEIDGVAVAVSRAQSVMPVDLPDSRVRLLIEGLCAATTDDVDTIVAQLERATPTDPAARAGVLRAIDAGTAQRCPGAVDPRVRAAVGARLSPPLPEGGPSSATSTGGGSDETPGAVDESGSGPKRGTTAPGRPSGTGSGSGSGSSSGATGSGGSTGSSGSTSTAAAGGGNADGAGNRSTTDYNQSVESSSGTDSSTPG